MRAKEDGLVNTFSTFYFKKKKSREKFPPNNAKGKKEKPEILRRLGAPVTFHLFPGRKGIERGR